MLYIESDAINEYILNELLIDKLDFISNVISPFHALGVDAFVYELFKKKNKNLNGLVFIYPHPKDGIVINETNFRSIEFANIKFVYVQKSATFNKKSILQLSNSAIGTLRGFLKIAITKIFPKRDLYIISVMDISISSFKLFDNKIISNKYSPTFVSIDEGLGSYMDEDVWKLVRIYDKDDVNPERNNLKTLLEKTFSKSMTLLTKFIIKVENRHLFIKSNNSLIPNKESVKAYKEVLTLSKSDIPKCIYPLLENKWAVIATQPFVDYGQVEADEYISIISDTLNLLENNGFGIALKPHPRENIEIYRQIIDEKKDIVLLPKSITLEDVLQLHPDITIGLTSTVLVTSKLFYEIESISIIDILLQSTDDPLLEVTAKQFKEKFGKLVYFANSGDVVNGIMKI